jgi:hypothetical protein
MWMKRVLDKVVCTDFALCSVFTATSRLAKVVSVKFVSRQRMCAVLWETLYKRWAWGCTKMADVPLPGFRKYWTHELVSLKSECHTITNKYPEGASVAQLSDIEYLVGNLLSGPELWTERRRTQQTFVKVQITSDILGLLTARTGDTKWTEGRPEVACTGRSKWCRECNLTGNNGSGPRFRGTRRQSTSPLNQSQHRQLWNCLQNQYQLAISSQVEPFPPFLVT